MAIKYKCKLSEKLIEKAAVELNEPRDNEKRLIEIEKLRTSFANSVPEIASQHNYDDVFYLRFLRTAKFNQDRALTMITNYHIQRQTWTEMFEKVNNPAVIPEALDNGSVLPLEGRAKDGSAVIIARPGINGMAVLIDMYAMAIMTLEKLLEDEEVQINGVTIIEDLAYMNMELIKQMTPSFAKKFVNFVQDAMPVRFKSLNFTNEPKAFDIIFAIVQPFLKDKMKKRIQVHGTNFSKLYNVVDKTVLPFMFAGSGPELDPEYWKSELEGEDTAL